MGKERLRSIMFISTTNQADESSSTFTVNVTVPNVCLALFMEGLMLICVLCVSGIEEVSLPSVESMYMVDEWCEDIEDEVGLIIELAEDES